VKRQAVSEKKRLNHEDTKTRRHGDGAQGAPENPLRALLRVFVSSWFKRGFVKTALALLVVAVSLAFQGESIIFSVAHAVNPDERLEDPKLEARARALSQELRCLVCQNQSIDDSSADLAHDLRVILRERIAAGDTDQQALDYLTNRYGDFVLLRPPVKPTTWALWFGPPALLVVAALALLAVARSRRRASLAPAPLSAEERSRLDAMLREERG
jgi:cytochrome c-type biogenesis protein CcmH